MLSAQQKPKAIPVREVMRPPDHKKGDPVTGAMYDILAELASRREVRDAIEIGSTDGRGSTRAFREGLEKNPNFPKVRLFCIEMIRPMFEDLYRTRKNYMKCFQVFSSPPKEHYSDTEIERFFAEDWPKNPFQTPSQKQEPEWHKRERDRYIAYAERARLPMDGITFIKDRYKIKNFDLALVDGGTYSGRADLKRVYGARYLVLDDIHTLKCTWPFQGLLKDPNYKVILHHPCTESHFGYAAFERVE